MESRVLPIFAFLLILLQVSHAAASPVTPSEVYWKTVLPNTPMPKAIRELIPPGKPLRHHVAGPPLNNYYQYKGPEDQLTRDVALFFLEKQLQLGTRMNLYFTRTTTGAAFLPRYVAESIPFSSKNLVKVMNQFSIEPDSAVADGMKQTLKLCGDPVLDGEVKLCATSLEAMVDFSTSMLGKNVQPTSTEIDKEETPKQQYTVAQGVTKVGGETSVVCHGQTYAYGVFYCHGTHSTNAYKVPLIGDDGTEAMALAVCHTNTSSWNPKHLAFQFLQVKPGTVPVCHILPEDDVVWASK